MRAARRVFAYARVSSAEQALGTSLQDQQNVCRAYAEKRGLKVLKFYVEAESAIHEKFERRIQIQSLLAEAREGDLVLVDKLDRWSRDPAFTHGSIRDLLAKRVDFYAVGDGCDPSTYEGDTMLNVRVLVAREEHKRIKQRMVGTRKILRDRGYFVEGLPPWGYRRQNVKSAERNALLVDEPEAARVRAVFRLCVEGRSMLEIANAIGTNRDRVFDTLHNRVYLGEVKDASGKWIDGKQARIIEPHLFVAAQQALDARRLGERRSLKRSRTADWWLRDLAYCALCGAKMSAAYGPSAVYFKCYARCTRRYINVRTTEEQAEPLVIDRLTELREDLAGAKEPRASSKAPIVDAAERKAKLEKKRARYVEAFSDGAMTRDQLREAMSKLDEERTKVDALAHRPAPVTLEQQRGVLRELTAMGRAWSKSTKQEKRLMVGTLAERVLLDADRRPKFSWFSIEILARRGGG